MSIDRASWNKWAPAAYLFIIGLAMGFGLGYALGMTGVDGAKAVFLALVPVAVILVAFVVLTTISKRMVN